MIIQYSKKVCGESKIFFNEIKAVRKEQQEKLEKQYEDGKIFNFTIRTLKKVNILLFYIR